CRKPSMTFVNTPKNKVLMQVLIPLLCEKRLSIQSCVDNTQVGLFPGKETNLNVQMMPLKPPAMPGTLILWCKNARRF
ncbi:MAG: hypothetical protein ABL903_16750, partial [Methylococcales bacterium]